MLDAIFERRSIRRYQNRPVEPEKIELILKAAMYAPSANNRRPWHFIVVDDREMLKRIMEAHPYAGMLATAPVCVVVLGDTSLETPGYYPVDCAAATQNILLSAWELGLGTCWMGVTPRGERMVAISKLFGLPEHIKPFSLVAVGYPDETKKRPDRFLPERIKKNTW